MAERPALVHTVVWHPDDHRILLDPDGALPSFAVEDRWKPEIPRRLRERFGIDAVPLLRPLRRLPPKGEEGVPALLCDVLEAHAAPAGLRWDHAPTALPDPLRGCVDALLAEAAGGVVPALRNPWARRGWHARAEAWIRAQAPDVATVEPVKNWSLSCVLKAVAPERTLWFKVSTDRPLFADEGAVTAALARRFPGAVPAPVARETDAGWMLLPDVGAPIGGDGDCAPLLTAFARMQAATASDPDALIAAGCLDRRAETLCSHLEALLADVSDVAGLKDGVADRLRAGFPDLARRIRRLADGPLPPTLVHGDLHAGNASARPDGGFAIFDWTDACVAHPLCDLLQVEFAEEASEKARLLDAYADGWGMDREAMARLWDDARPAMLAHHAVSYGRIEGTTEPVLRHELGDSCAHFLDALAETL